MDAIFKALNDPTRRALLDSLRQKDGQSLQELEETAEMTRFGVMKHLKLLEEAGLVVPVKKGRFKYHYLNAVPLQEVIDRWIDPFLAKPAARGVLNLKAKLEGTAPMTTPDTKPDFVSQTFIRCTRDALWSALTEADQVGQYHFLAETAHGDMTAKGEAMVFEVQPGVAMVRTEVIAIDPKSRIEATFEPSWAGPGMEPSRCVYLVDDEGAFCKLTIEHYGIPEGQEGIADGWARYASGLKTWLESGETVRFLNPAEGEG
ncbi:MAG: SRPBCC domain-containing protein [Pseudomonadota bacterium]